MLRGIRRRRHYSNVAQRFVGAQSIRDESDQHADARGSEPKVPTYFLTKHASDEWSDQRAGVDAHVKNREPCITPGSAFRVKIADDCRDVRLQQAGADDDEDQADEKS